MSLKNDYVDLEVGFVYFVSCPLTPGRTHVVLLIWLIPSCVFLLVGEEEGSKRREASDCIHTPWLITELDNVIVSNAACLTDVSFPCL